MSEYKTLTDALIAQQDPDKTVTFIEGKHEQNTISYPELYERVMMLLYDLQEFGLKAGDQLIILQKDNQAFVETFWACIFAGIVPVPIAVGISDEHKGKFFRIFNKLEHAHLYTTQEHFERLSQFAESNSLHESLQVVKNKTVFSDLMKNHQQQGQAHKVSEDDVAFIQFSSGSTSEPKGVVLTHKNIMNNLNAITTRANHKLNDIGLSWMPLTHDMGLLGFHLNLLSVGMSQNIMPPDLFSRRPLLWMEKISELKATITCSPNFGFKHYLKALKGKPPEGLDLSCVRIIYNGAEPISIDLCEQFLSTLKKSGLKHETMYTVYGLAEATLAVAFPVQGQSYRATYLDRHSLLLADKVKEVKQDHPDAIGFVIEGLAVSDMQIKITDVDNKILANNSIGLVQIKGPSVTAGYYLADEANKVALTGGGWLNTGDLGFLNPDNELVISGREKDIIFSNGLNYYPHDIEAVALQLPELELGKIVAYGVREANSDTDRLIVFVLFRADVKDFIGIVRDITRHINEQTGLQVEKVVPVKRIPKTTSGKLQRRLLGDAFLQGEFNEQLHLIEGLLTEASEQDTGDLSSTEHRLKTLFEELLEGKTISVEFNFFETGISSLTLTEFHEKVEDVYPGVVDVTDIFEYQTLAELAKFIDEKSPAS